MDDQSVGESHFSHGNVCGAQEDTKVGETRGAKREKCLGGGGGLH